MEFQKKFKKRERLSLIYYIFSALSILTGLFLIIYFIVVFSNYLSVSNAENTSLKDLIQEVDILGGVHGILWLLIGIVLYSLGVRVQLVNIRLLLEYQKTGSPYNDTLFETVFISLSKNLLTFKNKSEFELIQPGPNGKMHSGKIKGYDFFDRVYVQYTEIYKYTRGENTIDTDIQKLISMLGISDEEIKSVQDDPERCLILISGKFHKQYQEILNQFLSMNYRLFSFIESSLANEISRCQDPECIDHANIKYREYIEFALAHMTSSEMLVLFYFSKLEKPLSAMLDKLNVFRDIKPEKLIEQNHISLHPQTQGT